MRQQVKMINSFSVSKNRKTRRDIPIQEYSKTIADKGNVLWVDIKDPSKDELSALAGIFNFHPLAIEDTIRFVELPKIDEYDSHLFVVFHKVSLDIDTEKLNTQEIDFFLGKNFIVTAHRGDCEIIEQVIEKVIKDAGILKNGPDFIMYSIMDIAIDQYFPVLDKFDDKLVEIEENLVKSKTNGDIMEQLINIKRNFGVLKRSLNPQRDVISRLASHHYKLISAHTTLYFKDIYDHIFRIYSTLESYNDLATVIFDAYLSTISVKLNETSNKMNYIMQKLTLVATIFMPLTFIASVYGMNFKHMPELEWSWSYYAVLALMGIISVWLFFFFKKKRLL